MKCDSQTVPAHKSRCFPVCNTAKLISIFHVSSYSLRSHAQRDLYWVGSHSCQAFVVKVKTSTTIFHQLTQSHSASVCPLESPRMQLCVRERRWKFWFVQFRAWWLTSVDCGKRSVFHTGSVSHISFAIFFLSFFLWGSDTSNKAALSDLHISRDGRIWSWANRNIYLFPLGACLAEWPYLVAGLRALIELDCLSNRILGLLVPS